MAVTHKALKYVITNADRTKFFAFGGGERHYSDMVTNAALAEHFPSRESAGNVITEGQKGRWGTIEEHGLTAVLPISIEVTVK
jgi:hypothetical protein